MIKKHILLVDDDEGYRFAAAKALEAADFDVVAVGGFEDALNHLDSLATIDLLIVDIVMKVNGFALARMARFRRPTLKTLYMSGFEVPAAHEAMGKLIRKPAAMEELVTEVRLAIESELAAE